MSEPIVLATKHRIKPGQLDGFRHFYDQAVPALEDAKPRTIFVEPGKTCVDIDTVSAWGLFSPLAAVAAFSDRAMRSLRPGGGSG